MLLAKSSGFLLASAMLVVSAQAFATEAKTNVLSDTYGLKPLPPEELVALKEKLSISLPKLQLVRELQEQIELENKNEIQTEKKILGLSSTLFGLYTNLANSARYSVGENVSGAFSPMSEITLGTEARRAFHIPSEATHFTWVYPAKDQIALMYFSAEIRELLTNGGYAYLAGETLVGLNTFVFANNGFGFNGISVPVNSADDTYMKFSDLFQAGLFHEVTFGLLRDRGARFFSWFQPGELAMAPHGAFVYLLDDGSYQINAL